MTLLAHRTGAVRPHVLGLALPAPGLGAGAGSR